MSAPLSWIGWLNVLVLQWLGLRLAYWFEIKRARWQEIDGFEIIRETRRRRRALHIGVVLLTGWWSRYIGPLWTVRR